VPVTGLLLLHVDHVDDAALEFARELPSGVARGAVRGLLTTWEPAPGEDGAALDMARSAGRERQTAPGMGRGGAAHLRG
jgi:hypothetical protein